MDINENLNCEVEWVTIDDICQFRRGSFPQPYGSDKWYGGLGEMPFVQVADMQDDTLNLHNKTKKTISKLAQPNSVFVKSGTILVSIQGTIGRVAIAQYDCFLDRTIAVFYDYKISINKRFFAYQLQRIFNIKKEKARGGILKTITKEEFKNFKIPLPPLAVQNEIVKILDAFSELTAELTARVKQYEYYRDKLLSFENKFDEVEWVELENLCEIITKQTGFDYSKTIKPSLKETNEPNCYPFIQNKDFEGFSINYDTDFFVPFEVAHKFPKILLSSPTILISISGKIGNVAYFKGTKKAFAGGAVGICKLKNGSNGRFLTYYLQTTNGQKSIKKLIKASAHSNITIADIRKLKIPLPPLQIQEKIVEVLDNFDKICNDLNIGLPKEIELRNKQYEYYRDKLLSFENGGGDEALSKLNEYIYGVKFVELGEAFIIKNGYTPSKSNKSFWENGTIPWFRMDDIRKNGRILSNSLQKITPQAIKGGRSIPKNSIILATTATIGEHALVIADSFLMNQRFTSFTICELLKDKLDSKFAFYYFFKICEWCKKNTKSSTFPAVNMEALKKQKIPLPPLEIQEKIVEILDNFDKMCNDLKEGLPREIELRNKQYEYYRDRLLSFNQI